MEWFRFYDGVLDDRKVQSLPCPVFRGWINLLCLANEGDGILPPLPDIAFRLRLSDEQAKELIDHLLAAHLLDELPGGALEMHNWNERQRPSDNSKTRVDIYRAKQRTKALKSTRSAVTLQSPLLSRDSNGTEERRQEERREETSSAPPAPPDEIPAETPQAQQKKELEKTQKGWYEQLWPQFWNKDESSPGWTEFKKRIRTQERFDDTMRVFERQLPKMLKREPQYRKTLGAWLRTQPWKDVDETPAPHNGKTASIFRDQFAANDPPRLPPEREQELKSMLSDPDDNIRNLAQIALGMVH